MARITPVESSIVRGTSRHIGHSPQMTWCDTLIMHSMQAKLNVTFGALDPLQSQMRELILHVSPGIMEVT